MMIRRDAKGRVAGDPTNPFADQLPPERLRDGRSGRPQRAAPTQICLKVPLKVMLALRIEAQKRGVSVTNIVLNGLKKELSPELFDKTGLHDTAVRGETSLGQNARLPRLDEQIPSPLNSSPPKFAKVENFERRQAEKKAGFKGRLVDRPIR